jgi:glycosyltransferase involved in cell wall biosynthesis
MLAHFFPPVGGGSAQRNLGLVRVLRELGWESVVVTGPGQAEDYWAPQDRSLLASVPADLGVTRVQGPEPPASQGLRRRVERLLDLEPEWYRWWMRGALEAGRTMCGRCDLVYASLEPYESAWVAATLAEEFGVPWVAELLDPWALDEMRFHVTGVHRRRDLGRMRRWLRSADAVIMNTGEARRRAYAELPELRPALVEPIPVGYDPAPFELPAQKRDDSAFRIVHTGYLHTEAGLRHQRTQRLRRAAGGLYAPINLLARSHFYLLRAIDRVIQRDPGLATLLELHLAGVPTAADRELARRSPVTRLHGYVSHEQSVDLLRGGDLLFLPMYDVAARARAGLVPAKTYEYLAARRPILAAVPPGDARDLLVEAGNARLVAPTDDAAMAELIAADIRRWRAGTPPDEPDPDVVSRYTHRAVATRLAGVFANVLAARST